MELNFMTSKQVLAIQKAVTTVIALCPVIWTGLCAPGEWGALVLPFVWAAGAGLCWLSGNGRCALTLMPVLWLANMVSVAIYATDRSMAVEMVFVTFFLPLLLAVATHREWN